MSYNIVLTNGQLLTTVPDQTVDSATTSLSLLGEHYADYGTIFNNNFVHLLENAADGNAPDNPLTGQLWFDTDTATLNVWNSTQWNTLSSGSSPVINVYDFGAAGNGTADDTSAIQTAINLVQSNGGGIVFIPAGTFKITGTLTITGAVRLLGAGRNATILNFVNTTHDCIVVNNGTTFVYGVELADFQMTFTSKTGGRAIYLSYAANSTLHDLLIVSPWDGIDIYITNTILIYNSTILTPQDTTGYALRWGAPSDGSNRSDNLTCRDVVINCGYLGADGVRWYGLAATFYWYAGAILETNYGLLITNPTESVSNAPQFLESFAMGIEGCTKQAVRIEGGQQFHFIDAVLSNSSGTSGQGGADTQCVYIASDAGFSYTNSLKFIGCRMGLCAQEVVYCAGRSVQFVGCTLVTGSMSSHGTYAALHLAAPAQDIIVTGCMDYEWGSQLNHSYAVQIDNGCFRYFVTGNNFFSDNTKAVLNNAVDRDGRIALNGSSQAEYFTPQILPTNSAISSGTTWSASFVLAGVFIRSGVSANFTDTLPSAAAIVAALTEPNVGAATPLMVINETGVTMSLQAGAGVTLGGITSGGKFTIAANTSRWFWVTATTLTAGSEAVTIYG